MIVGRAQNWRMSSMPWSLSLTNTVNTGVSFDTPSRAIGITKFWQGQGFRGYGPTRTFPGGSGFDGCDCGCGCGDNTWIWLLAAGALIWLCSRREVMYQ